MRTKEDYLKNKIGDSDNPIYHNQHIHDAMQEHADEQSVAFADFLVKSYQPRFPNKGEWTKINPKEFRPIYTTTELLQIFKNENK